MKGDQPFSWHRMLAMMIKEFLQVSRDRLTFAMMVGIPMIQLVLFGYAIDSDPRHLPTAVLDADHGLFARDMVAAMQASRYFQLVEPPSSTEQADDWLATGHVQFVLRIPADFSRQVARGDHPALLVEADATDPVATAGALAALRVMAGTVFDHDLHGPLARLRVPSGAFELRLHSRYNQEADAHFNIVPGLIGVVLTMTMVVMTALAVTRERERGTLETLLVMPLSPLEVMLGKIIPYVIVGFIQVAIIIGAAQILFNVPILGSVPLLLLVSTVFIAVNLAVGFTFSTIASNQMQAMQMSFFFFLPSILLSGFMFPFRGMPQWAQKVGEAFPLTHYLRVVRGIMLKGNGWNEIAGETAILIITLVLVCALAVHRYQRTLD